MAVSSLDIYKLVGTSQIFWVLFFLLCTLRVRVHCSQLDQLVACKHHPRCDMDDHFRNHPGCRVATAHMVIGLMDKVASLEAELKKLKGEA